MRTDWRRLRAPELVVGAASVLVAVSLFLPWFEFSGAREDAWRALTVAEIPAAIAALLGIALVVVTLTRRSPALPLAVAVVLTTVTTIAAIVIAVRAGDPPSGATDRCYGLWLGLGGLVVLLVGAVWSLRDERPYRGVAVTG